MSDIEDHHEADCNDMIADYRVVRKLGTGTFGRVFLCCSTKPSQKQPKYQPKPKGKSFSQRDADRARRDEEALQEAEQEIAQCLVAVKVVRPVPKYIEEAKEEVSYIRTFKSPYLIDCIDAKPWRDRFLIVTPAYGYNIHYIIKHRGYKPIKTELALLYAEQVCKALCEMHSKGFAHTDIKPENILVQHMDNPKQGIKLIDLGGTYPREKFGDQCIQTRQFRAPEVVLGREWNEKVDIWSVGCTLFEMVTGDVLFPAHDPRTHLAMIERAVGEFPEYMSSDNSNFDDGAVKFPSNGMSQETIDTIVQVLPLKRCVERRIYSFLRLMLRICPEERASAQQIVDKFSRWHKRGLL